MAKKQITALQTAADAADDDLLIKRDASSGTDEKLPVSVFRDPILDRANHTGTQPLSTISDAGTAAANDTTDFVSTSSQVAFRNILINPRVNTSFAVNQRGFGGDWSTLANGDYGYDRWARKDASTIAQVIEEGNYKSNTTYTLSGVNVTTQQITSPASGNWQVEVPNTAQDVQLEEGAVATPFELRPIGMDIFFCQRYYFKPTNGFRVYDNDGNEANSASITVSFPSQMKETPSISYTLTQGQNDSTEEISKTHATIVAEVLGSSGNKRIEIDDFIADASPAIAL